MNTETTHDNSATLSTGERLRAAREQMGLTQQHVAERLCLKLSTVRDLEEDRSPAGLALTFLHGYIRSYARLVHVSEKDLLPALAKQMSVRAGKMEPIQRFSLDRRRKKGDRWLMICTWLVLLVVTGLTGAWWWQNHQAAQDDLGALGKHNSTSSLPGLQPGNSVATSNSTTPAPLPDNSLTAGNHATDSAASAMSASQTPLPQPTSDSPPQVAQPDQATADNHTRPDSQEVVNDGETSTPPVDPNAIVLSFTNDCWLEVTDAAGKKLFSGMQHNGGKLSLAGTAPYRLKIGAPAAVQIQYQGKPVDLSRFIRTNQVARLSLGAR